MSAPTPSAPPSTAAGEPATPRVVRRRNRKPKPQLAVPASTVAAMAALTAQRGCGAATGSLDVAEGEEAP